MAFVCFGLLLLAAGQASGELVKLQSADPACADDSANVFVSCGNGTATDNRTGLVWLEFAGCIEPMDWETAVESVAGLSAISPPSICTGTTCDCFLYDNSAPGDWRLPTVAEWQALVADAVALGCTFANGPTMTSDNGLFCWTDDAATCYAAGTTCSFFQIFEDTGYWSSTFDVENPANAWEVSLVSGLVYLVQKTTQNRVWAVRDGR